MSVHPSNDSPRRADERRILLDFSGIDQLHDLHRMLKRQFDLPEYYGENWDALWDCLDGLFRRDGAVVVELRGYASMSESMRRRCAPMLEIFREVQEDAPNVQFIIT